MTGTASSRGRLFTDFDNHKHQEWLRRRKLRIEQVRKQSTEMARSLRQKVTDKDKAKADEYENIKKAELKCWKADKLDELEGKLRGALDDFGRGHKEAEVESDPEEVMQTRNQINMLKAQERGEMAQKVKLRRKKVEEEKKMSSINRKIMTRKMEDLRSALVCSIPVQKQLIHASEDQGTNIHDLYGATEKKATLKKKKVSKEPGKKVGVRKARTQKTSNSQQVSEKLNKNMHEEKVNQKNSFEEPPTVWINLNEIQSSLAIDSESKQGSSKTGAGSLGERDKSNRMVEFYDYPSRYYCKSFREFSDLVKKIDPESEPDANEMAKIEEERKMKEAGRKHEADVISKERGMEALRRERIIRDYNNLITKLEELNKKEKIIKAHHCIHPSLIHMNDERLSEKKKAKQRVLDSKFENIFYVAAVETGATTEGGRGEFDRAGGGDCITPGPRTPTKLSFSPSNLKNNSPVTPPRVPSEPSNGNSSVEQTPACPGKEKAKNKKRLLSDIDKVLREGRQLRKTVSRTRKSCDSKSLADDSESENKEGETIRSAPSATKRSSRQSEETEKLVKSHDRESQTEDLNSCGKAIGIEGAWKWNCKAEDDSLPLSTSTSYKSPPSVIRSCRLRQFLDYLEGFGETEENVSAESDPDLRKKMKKVLKDLMDERKSEDEMREFAQNPTLRYYILKLLSMSRECVADLSVSSENISTASVADLDGRDKNGLCLRSISNSECSFKASPKGEELVRAFRLKRAADLEQTIKNWKAILENNIKEKQPTVSVLANKLDFRRFPVTWAEDELGRGSESEEMEKVKLDKEPNIVVLYSPKTSTKYERITKKCSDRISELSDMLNKVRKDKEKLLNSNSGTSSASKDERDFENKFYRIKEKVSSAPEELRLEGGDAKYSPLEDGFNFLDRYGWSREREENESTAAVVGSQSFAEDLADSPESLPDAMDELFKRNILSSPFKWSEGENSLELSVVNENCHKFSSIETLIGNFRKEISKIKPFSLTFADAFPPSKAGNFSSAKKKSEEPFGSPERQSFFPDFESGSEHVFLSKESAHKRESSVESINHALTSLGLNWAKSFLKKNEESRAMTSSSGSDQDKASLD